MLEHQSFSQGWHEIRTLYRYELRAAWREKSIVINSLLIPLLLYPFILWAMFTGFSFLQGESAKSLSRVAVQNWPAEHRALRSRLEHHKQISIVPLSSPDATNAVKHGEVDALVTFFAPTNPALRAANNFNVRITYDGSSERSDAANDRVREVIEDYRADWLKQEGHNLGIKREAWTGFALATHNIASRRQMGGFVLGTILPTLFVIMVAVGCFFPAIDSIAGERERQTWETLMSSGANRRNIVIAKYLYVATLGALAGVLNVTAMAVTAKPIMGALLAQGGRALQFAVPLGAIPIVALAAILLAGFISAGMMILASFARTFKEGQSMTMPFYMLSFLPAMFLQAPGLKFSVPIAFLPVGNITMMVRSAVSGSFPWLPMTITVLVSLTLIAACLAVAAFILRFEDVVLGSYNGSFIRFIKERAIARKRRHAGSIS